MTKALTVGVFRAAGRPDCTLNGVSKRFADLAIVGVVDQRKDFGARAVEPLSPKLMLPDWRERAEGEAFASAPVALIVRRLFGDAPFFHLEPVIPDGEGGWQLATDKHGPTMAGGNFASTSDSRLAELIRTHGGPQHFYGALPVHDRMESWDLYYALTKD